MDAGVEELAQHLVHRLDYTPSPRRVIVGISGVPASGKSTLAHAVTERVNKLLKQRSSSPEPGPQAILVGLDGWHLTRAQLDVFPDPQAAYDRRGSHWTFDGPGYVSFVQKLRDESTPDNIVLAPSFDHAIKDPTPDALSIHPYHRIVIIEGLYTFLSIEPWSEAGLLLDERWFIEVDLDEARRRLVGRHVLTGVTKDAREAEWRADENDMPNGQFIVANMLEPTRVITSKDDPKYVN
ncbi:hypothetical protein NLJ89_g5380 [Agrocybe chaxingu]|uniref:P-loop containing nucleoside triphosphate hydrolase protein n=1 Tax=Agrocybe chaxingu TaxID=84603 RepID=A0A9W8MXA4_9AGAR|nr:hypothetical protein NLJ89_g5380 [Agrocybe chaxingu]